MALNLGTNRFSAYYGSRQNLFDVYREMMDAQLSSLLRDEPQREFVVLKDPYLSVIPDNIFNVFPEAKVVSIYRSPADVIKSIKKISEIEDFDYDSYLPFYLGLRRFIGANNTKRNHLTVYYEDLIADSDWSLARISNFLGYDVSKPPVGRPDDVKGSKFSTDKLLKPLTNVVSEDQSTLSNDELKLIEDIYGDLEVWFARRKKTLQSEISHN